MQYKIAVRMLHFDIPRKPIIEDYGLDTKHYIAEKKKQERMDKVNVFLSSIPWGYLPWFVVYFFVGLFIWRHTDFNIVWRIIASVLGGCLLGSLGGSLTLYCIFLPFWFARTIIGKKDSDLVEFINDCLGDFRDFLENIFHKITEPLTKLKGKRAQAYSDYAKASSDYERTINYLKYRHPELAKCGWDEKRYTNLVFQEILPDAIKACKDEIESINKRADERWWGRLEPKRFEEEVAKWFIIRGYSAEVTQFVGDGGVDIVVKKDGEKAYVQCKHYADKVPVSVVRELFGVMASDHVEKGFIACLHGLSSNEAYAFARKNSITVIDLEELVKGAKRLPIQETNCPNSYVVGPFSIHKDVYSSRDEAVSPFVSRPELSISVIRIKDYYMTIYSNDRSFLNGYNVERFEKRY